MISAQVSPGTQKLTRIDGVYRVSEQHAPFSGEYQEFHANGRLKESKRLVEGRLHGLSVAYGESGRKISERHYRDDKIHGYERKYSERTGRLLQETIYADGKKHGLERFYNRTHGYLMWETPYKEDLVDGPTIYYDQHGKRSNGSITFYYVDEQTENITNIVHTVRTVSNGLADGISRTYYKSGKIWYTVANHSGYWHGEYREYSEEDYLLKTRLYRRGKQAGLERWFRKDGTHFLDREFEDGVRIKEIWYFESGVKSGETTYREGKPHGTGVRFREDGSIQTKRFYLNGVQTKEQEIAPEGHVTAETPYLNGKRHGLQRFFDGKGNVVREIEWSDGKNLQQAEIDRLSKESSELARQRDYAGALRLAESALALDPENPSRINQVVDCLAQLKQFNDAARLILDRWAGNEDLFERFSSRNARHVLASDFAEEGRQLAMAQFKDENAFSSVRKLEVLLVLLDQPSHADEVRSHLEKAVTLFADKAELYRLAGEYYAKPAAGANLTLAVDFIERGLDRVELTVGLVGFGAAAVKILHDAGKVDRAAETVVALCRMSPMNFSYSGFLFGDVMRAAGRQAEAKAMALGDVTAEKRTRPNYWSVRCLFREFVLSDDVAGALAVMEQVLARKGPPEEALRWIVESLDYYGFGEHLGRYLPRYLEHLKEDDHGRWSEVGRVFESLGNLDRALECYRKAVSTKSGGTAHLRGMVRILRQRKELDRALLLVEEALAANAEGRVDNRMVREKAGILMSMGRHKESIVFLESSYQASPSLATGLVLMEAYRVARMPEPMEALGEALIANVRERYGDQNPVNALRGVASVRAALGETDVALANYREALGNAGAWTADLIRVDLAMVYLRLGGKQSAIEQVIDPDREHLRDSFFTEIVNQLHDVLALEPDHPEARALLAWVPGRRTESRRKAM